jgi:hypothetical protein
MTSELAIIKALGTLPRWQRKRSAGYRIDNRASFCVVTFAALDGALMTERNPEVVGLLDAAGLVASISGAAVVVCERRAERGGK